MSGRNIACYVVAVVVLVSFQGRGGSDPLQKAIVGAFSEGKASYLTPYMASEVRLKIGGGTPGQLLSNIQAERILQEFFRTFPPQGFSLIHRGRAEGDQTYWMGTYRTENARKFRVYIIARVVRNSPQIVEIRISEAAR